MIKQILEYVNLDDSFEMIIGDDNLEIFKAIIESIFVDNYKLNEYCNEAICLKANKIAKYLIDSCANFEIYASYAHEHNNFEIFKYIIDSGKIKDPVKFAIQYDITRNEFLNYISKPEPPAKTQAKIIYVAGPITSSGTIPKNVRNALKIADELWKKGWTPIVPHLSIYWEMATEEASERTWEDWMSWCRTILTKCDAVFRIPGESKGADEEEKIASDLGLPIYSSIESLP